MMIQSFEPAVKLIQTRIKATKKRKAKNLSVSSVFRDLRANSAFSFFGDYPLLGLATDEIKKAGFNVRRDSLFRVMQQSEELSEVRQGLKTVLVDQLMESRGEHSTDSDTRGKAK